MEVGLFVLGVLVGVITVLLERYRRDETAEREAHFNALGRPPERDPRSDSALAETKDRLIAMQMEHRAADARAKPLEAELAQAKRAAEQATEQEMKQRQLNAELQDELVALKRGARGGKAAPSAVKPAEPAPAPKPDAMATTTGADDLTVIKGIGKVIEEAAQLGITSFSQIAAMTPDRRTRSTRRSSSQAGWSARTGSSRPGSWRGHSAHASA